MSLAKTLGAVSAIGALVARRWHLVRVSASETTLDEVVELLDTLDEDGDNNIDKHEFLRQMRAVQNERRRRARAARGTSANSVSSTPVATGPLRRTRQSRAERASAAKKKHIDRLRELS